MAYVPPVVHGQNEVSCARYGCKWIDSWTKLTRLEKNSVGNAKIAGMADDLDLSSDRYSLVLTLFFVGYVVFEVPSK